MFYVILLSPPPPPKKKKKKSFGITYICRNIADKNLIQSTFAISIMRYLVNLAISNKSPGPFSIYGQTRYKFTRYLELRYLELFAISNFFLGP